MSSIPCVELKTSRSGFQVFGPPFSTEVLEAVLLAAQSERHADRADALIQVYALVERLMTWRQFALDVLSGVEDMPSPIDESSFMRRLSNVEMSDGESYCNPMKLIRDLRNDYVHEGIYPSVKDLLSAIAPALQVINSLQSTCFAEDCSTQTDAWCEFCLIRLCSAHITASNFLCGGCSEQSFRATCSAHRRPHKDPYSGLWDGLGCRFCGKILCSKCRGEGNVSSCSSTQCLRRLESEVAGGGGGHVRREIAVRHEHVYRFRSRRY